MAADEILECREGASIRERMYYLAYGELGVAEIADPGESPRIGEYQKTVGLNADDEVPWCAAFVNWICWVLGILGTGKANARSFLKWGVQIPLSEAKPGDVVVLWRVSKDSWQGHVAIYYDHDDTTITLLGGNQGNKVCFKKYDIERVLEVRRYQEAA